MYVLCVAFSNITCLAAETIISFQHIMLSQQLCLALQRYVRSLPNLPIYNQVRARIRLLLAKLNTPQVVEKIATGTALSITDTTSSVTRQMAASETGISVKGYALHKAIENFRRKQSAEHSSEIVSEAQYVPYTWLRSDLSEDLIGQMRSMLDGKNAYLLLPPITSDISEDELLQLMKAYFISGEILDKFVNRSVIPYLKIIFPHGEYCHQASPQGLVLRLVESLENVQSNAALTIIFHMLIIKFLECDAAEILYASEGNVPFYADYLFRMGLSSETWLRSHDGSLCYDLNQIMLTMQQRLAANDPNSVLGRIHALSMIALGDLTDTSEIAFDKLDYHALKQLCLMGVESAFNFVKINAAEQLNCQVVYLTCIANRPDVDLSSGQYLPQILRCMLACHNGTMPAEMAKEFRSMLANYLASASSDCSLLEFIYAIISGNERKILKINLSEDELQRLLHCPDIVLTAECRQYLIDIAADQDYLSVGSFVTLVERLQADPERRAAPLIRAYCRVEEMPLSEAIKQACQAIGVVGKGHPLKQSVGFVRMVVAICDSPENFLYALYIHLTNDPSFSQLPDMSSHCKCFLQGLTQVQISKLEEALASSASPLTDKIIALARAQSLEHRLKLIRESLSLLPEPSENLARLRQQLA